MHTQAEKHAPRCRRWPHRVTSSILLLTSSLLAGCNTSIMQPGVIQRARNLAEYTADGRMGRDFYDQRHYVGESPVSELEAHIASRHDDRP